MSLRKHHTCGTRMDVQIQRCRKDQYPELPNREAFDPENDHDGIARHWLEAFRLARKDEGRTCLTQYQYLRHQQRCGRVWGESKGWGDCEARMQQTMMHFLERMATLPPPKTRAW